MATSIKVKTAELIGPALDLAVAKATQKESTIGRQIVFGKTVFYVEAADSLAIMRGPFCPSTCWTHGGPLIDKYNIWLSGPIGDRKEWSAAIDLSTDDVRGATALIALCRALVESKLGEEVWVPAELMGVAV